jgi:type II secretory pathway pseudopilin PulG
LRRPGIKKERGFTLIGLRVVVAIIGDVSAIVVPM